MSKALWLGENSCKPVCVCVFVCLCDCVCVQCNATIEEKRREEKRRKLNRTEFNLI